MKRNLNSEIHSFKYEIRNCITNVHTSISSEISETEKQLSSKTSSDNKKHKKLKMETNRSFLELIRNPKRCRETQS